MLEGIKRFFKKQGKKEDVQSNSKNAAKERLHLVLMQDRANVSVDFLDMMKQEIIDVIKKYVDVDEPEIDVRLTNQINEDGTNGAPALYANIPIVSIKNEKIGEKKKINLKNNNYKNENEIPGKNNTEKNVDTKEISSNKVKTEIKQIKTEENDKIKKDENKEIKKVVKKLSPEETKKAATKKSATKKTLNSAAATKTSTAKTTKKTTSKK
ncbi:MAG: cell division topological specificity factor MinE [Clostridia bacterium]|nr:cell division topological specificity factor MinE [Clostridia bacterium]